MVTTFTTVAKFILSGEHYVVTGTPCLAVPAPCFRARIALYEDESVRGIETHCEFDTEQTYEADEIAEYEQTLSRIIAHALELYGLDPKTAGMRFVMRSSIPPSQGAGSSSAVCQAVVGVLAKHFFARSEMPNDYLYCMGKMLETWFHGRVSGVDNAVIASGKPICFIPNDSCSVIAMHEPFYFVVGSTGARQSPSPYEAVREIRTNAPIAYLMGSKDAATCVAEMFGTLYKGEHQRAGELMLSYHRMMKSMSLSTEDCDKAVNTAMTSGAFGAKITGAGRGGFVIALAPVSCIEKVQRAWIELGLKNVRSFCIGDDYRMG